MKKLLFTLGITLLCTVLNAQSPHFFYNYRGEKVFLSLNTNYAFLSVREQQRPTNMLRQRGIEAGTFRSDRIEYVLLPNDAQVRSEILQAGESGQNWFLTKQQAAPRFYTRLSFEAGMSDEEYLNLLSDIRQQNQGVIISPFFKTDRDNMVGLSNFFYVRLKEEGDIGLLIQKALQTNSPAWTRLCLVHTIKTGFT